MWMLAVESEANLRHMLCSFKSPSSLLMMSLEPRCDYCLASSIRLHPFMGRSAEDFRSAILVKGTAAEPFLTKLELQFNEYGGHPQKVLLEHWVAVRSLFSRISGV